MKKCLSLSTIAFVVFFNFSESNLNVVNQNLAEIPPVIISIPPMHLSVIDLKQEKIITNLTKLGLQEGNLL